jgi:chromosome segregation ATPase
MATEMENGKNGNGNGNGGDQKTFNTLSLIIAGLSLLMSLVFAFYTTANPKGDVLLIRQESREDLHREMTRVDADILRVKSFASDRLLSKTEHEEFARRMDKSTDNLREELNRVRADQVTRSEHIQHWTETTSRIDAVRDLNNQLRRENQEALSDLRKEIGGQYTLGDQIKNLQDQIKNLASRLDAVKVTKPLVTSVP